MQVCHRSLVTKDRVTDLTDLTKANQDSEVFSTANYEAGTSAWRSLTTFIDQQPTCDEHIQSGNFTHAIGDGDVEGNTDYHNANVPTWKNEPSHLVAPNVITSSDRDRYPADAVTHAISQDEITQGHPGSCVARAALGNALSMNLGETNSETIPVFFFCPHVECCQVFDSQQDCENHSRECAASAPSFSSSHNVEHAPFYWSENSTQDSEVSFHGGALSQGEAWLPDLIFPPEVPADVLQAGTVPQIANPADASGPDSTLAVAPALVLSSSQYGSPTVVAGPVNRDARRAIRPSARRQPTAAAASFRCVHPGCDKVYKRYGDMERHRRDKHGQKVFPCTFPRCDRMGGRAFGRADKLRDHLRKGHNLRI